MSTIELRVSPDWFCLHRHVGRKSLSENEGTDADFKPSECTSHFNSQYIVEQYIAKLDRLNINGLDEAPGELFTHAKAADTGNVPDLQNPDIYNYPFNFPSSNSRRVSESLHISAIKHESNMSL